MMVMAKYMGLLIGRLVNSLLATRRLKLKWRTRDATVGWCAAWASWVPGPTSW